MRALRYGLAIVGSVVFALALLVVVSPEAATAVRVDELVELVGNDYLLVVPLAVLAATGVLAVLAARIRSGVDQATPPDPEGVPTAPHPGSEFDQLADGGPGILGRLLFDETEHARDHLRETAIRTVMRADNCSREAARERVAAGDWTDDRAAAEFLADGHTRGGGPLAVLLGTTGFEREFRRAATAIAHYDGGPAYADGGNREAGGIVESARDGDASGDD